MLSNKEDQQLKFGLKHSSIDKNKNIKRLLAANIKRITKRVESYLDHDTAENFREFMRVYTDVFTNNIFPTKGYTYSNLK